MAPRSRYSGFGKGSQRNGRGSSGENFHQYEPSGGGNAQGRHGIYGAGQKKRRD